jgi:hypothetical protein
MTTETLDFVLTAKPDEAPPSSFDYACEVCGKELYYAGKGRHPRFCDEHKPNKGAGTSRGKGAGSNTQRARQASEVLVQVNSFVAIALMLPSPFQLPVTASALAAANDGFGEAAYEALLTDPELAKLILRGGGLSGRLALALAYAMLGGSVIPVGIQEFRERRADRPEVETPAS